MDKNTLGNYGWVVITVIIISIMIALASPFAGAIKGNFVGAVNDFGGRMDAALEGMTPAEPKEFVPGFYETGALEIYKTQGKDAVVDMLLMSYDEMVENGYITVENGVVTEYKIVLRDNTIEMNENDFYFELMYQDYRNEVDFILHENGTADVRYSDGNAMETVTASYERGIEFAFDGCTYRYFIYGGGYLLTDGEFIIGPHSSTTYSGDLILPNDESITSIGRMVFIAAQGLTGISIPSSVTNIEDVAFNACTNLREAYFEENSQTTSIGSYAFSSSGLIKLSIPNSITVLNPGCFGFCENLVTVNYSGTVDQLYAIELVGYDWFTRVPAEYIQCSDGQVSLP